MNVQNMNAFRAWRELGYTDLIPIVPPGAELTPDCHYSPQALGKQPGVPWRDGKWGPIKGWQHLTPNDDQIDHWGRIGASVGLRKGHVVAVDIDAMDERQGDEIEAAALSMLGPAPIRVGQWPKRALLYRTEPGAKFPKLRFKGVSGRSEQIEVPPQTVLDGIHSKTGLPYTWPRGKAPADALTLLTPEKWAAFHSAMRERLPFPDAGEGSSGVDRDTVDQSRLRGDPDLIARAMRVLPNRHELFGYDEWVKIATALRGAVDYELGLELFEEFSERSDLTETLEQPWRVFASVQPPFGLGASYLLDLAEKHSPEGAAIKAEAWLESGSETEFSAEKLVTLFGSSAAPALTFHATPYAFPEPSAIPRRSWLYDRHYIRKFVSATVAPSGVGKSSLKIAEALAIASGKPILGVQPHGAHRVWLWNGEDPRDELERRVAAAMMLHGLTREDVGDRLFLDTGREQEIVMARNTRDGAKIMAPMAAAIVETVQANAIDVLSIDPFVSTHQVTENDNGAIDLVTKQWAKIADDCNAAVELVHHVRKLNGGDISVEDGRGAVALLATSRSARALARMTKVEAQRLGLDAVRTRLFRFADAKNNLAPPLSDESVEWFELASVELGNGAVGSEWLEGASGTAAEAGDSVGVVRRYKVEATAVAAATGGQASALALIESGEWRMDPRAGDAWVGSAIASAMNLDPSDAADKATLKATIKDWLRSGVVRQVTRNDAQRRPRAFVEVVKQVDNLSKNAFE